MRSSQDLVIGQVYTRAELKEKFDIQDASINNGIFRPKGHDSVWLFVTKNKTSDRTQYHDLLDGDDLTMQGQTMGRTNHWIIDHEEAGQELLLFYRDSKLEYAGGGFRYEGPFRYNRFQPGNSLPNTFELKRVHLAQPNWKLLLEAVIELGGSVTPGAVLRHVLQKKPDFNEANLHPELATLTVNSPSRTSYGQNSRPRRTDEGSRYDRLFKVGNGKGVTFELYDPAQHGVWEIYADSQATSTSGMSIRQVVNPTVEALEAASKEAEQEGAFDVHSIQDARNRVFSSIVRRQGQAKFREALVEAYGGACAVTGCTLKSLLEAAHVHPYRGAQTNVVSNGLLLRTDIHTLFDLGLIAVESDSLKVCVSPELLGTEYADLAGKQLRDTALISQRVSSPALDWHRSRCGW